MRKPMGLIRLLYRNKSLVILCSFLYIFFWFSAGYVQPSVRSKQSKSVDQINQEPNSTLCFLLDYILKSQVKLLLIDPVVLDALFVRQLSFDQLDHQIITFAITDDTVDVILEYFKTPKFLLKFSENGSTNPKTSINHIFIEFNGKIIHIAVLHKYFAYYLIQPNTLLLSDTIELSFGDKLRTIDNLESQLHSYSFFYPRNVSHFLWSYETSEFILCNRILADRMEQEFHLYQNASQLSQITAPMRNVVAGLNQLEKHYWLAGGTLLGWYRHCGLIPFTQDVDFGLFAEEYDEGIRTYFLGNPISYLWGALGLVNDSLEFRLFTGRYTLDLFWAYPEGNQRWCGYQVNRLKYRRTLPLLSRLCSADLFGYRFTIPCSPDAYLNNEYGENNWQSPRERNYTWKNMKFHSTWNDVSWMYATRLYTPKGKLRTDKYAVDWISKHFNYSITSIPSFLNVVPDEPVTLPPLKSELVYGHRGKTKKRK